MKVGLMHFGSMNSPTSLSRSLAGVLGFPHSTSCLTQSASRASLVYFASKSRDI